MQYFYRKEDLIMSTLGNNINNKNSYVRDTFFSSKGEQKYLEKMMKYPKEKAIHNSLLRENAENLCKKAMDLIERVEQGEFDEKQMHEVEYLITHYLAGIEDLQKVLEKELGSEDFSK